MKCLNAPILAVALGLGAVACQPAAEPAPLVGGCDASVERFQSVDALVAGLYDLSPFEEAQMDSIFVLNDQIADSLYAVLSCAAGRETQLEGALGQLGFVESEDGRIRAFSWYGNNGGTFQEFSTLYQYFPEDGEVGVEAVNFSSGVASFVSLPADHPTYLGFAQERTCSTCVSEYAQVFTLREDSLSIATPAAFDARMAGILDFRYAPQTGTIHFAVALDDLNDQLRDEYEVVRLAESGIQDVDLEMLMNGADSEVVMGSLVWDGEQFRPVEN